MRTSICILSLSLLSCAARFADAQPTPANDASLEAAVEALGQGEHARGLELLEDASTRSDDPRIRYYRAYALEKLGRCAEARVAYEQAVDVGPERFAASARDALREFDTRCQPEPAPEARQRGRGTGWRLVGWVTASLGALTLGAVPIKRAIDRDIASDAEDLFEERYACTIDFGQIGKDCDEAAVRSNPYWATYEEKVQLAKRTNTYLIVGGSALLVLGVTSVIIGSTRPAVAVVPLQGGAYASVALRF